MNISDEMERKVRNESIMGTLTKQSQSPHNRGFHSSDVHKAAQELRMEGKGSHDPHYTDSKKNK